mmetsp:Transcript_9448/g.28190  ORF Transcript_9448/g.28190 Transcript_9448/m.28190 type:complete len:95 (+) Transcript_9448:196-480(+)
MIKSVFSNAIAIFIALVCVVDTQAFQPHQQHYRKCISSTHLYGYVPSGFTPEQYKKFKEQEAKKSCSEEKSRWPWSPGIQEPIDAILSRGDGTG